MDKQLTMLIVDDEAINRSILRGIFECDYELSEAENGEEALKILRSKGRVDIILLDIVMPVMNGLTFLETIKKDSELS